MATMAQNDSEKLCVPVNEKLLIELRTIKAEYGLDWNSLILHLIRVNPSPEKLVRRYERKFQDKKLSKVNFEPRCSGLAIIEFGKWCAPFSNQGDALDYLICEERSRSKFELSMMGGV